MSAARGTTNCNARGSSYARRKRREWLVANYRANVDVKVTTGDDTTPPVVLDVMPLGEGAPACRCYRCGELLTVDTVTADRIIPGDAGGTYRRNNIRPACGRCNSITGNEYRWSKPGARKLKAVPA